jgi:ribosomal protein S18 acetylase RimI-like enzyme
MRRCSFCDGNAQYRDQVTGQYVCLVHARLEVVAVARQPSALPLTVRPAVADDYRRIEELALYFWNETEVDCFDRKYDVLACPAFLVCDGGEAVGQASYAVEEEWNAVVLVMLNILPDQQRRGGGWLLLDAVRDEARRCGLERLLVVTSNDDLPALALYQRYGFCITGILPGRIAADHGGAFPGLAGIPVRDEIRLAYEVPV